MNKTNCSNKEHVSDKPLSANESVNLCNKLHDFQYDEGTRTNNVILMQIESRRNKVRTFDCNNKLRNNKMRERLRKKLVKRKKNTK